MMTSQEMLDKFRADGSYERTIIELMDQGVIKKDCRTRLHESSG
jgi:hypothetical protein